MPFVRRNRTVAQIHALPYITGRPMHAGEIVETLAVARSSVSNSAARRRASST